MCLLCFASPKSLVQYHKALAVQQTFCTTKHLQCNNSVVLQVLRPQSTCSTTKHGRHRGGWDGGLLCFFLLASPFHVLYACMCVCVCLCVFVCVYVCVECAYVSKRYSMSRGALSLLSFPPSLPPSLTLPLSPLSRPLPLAHTLDGWQMCLFYVRRQHSIECVLYRMCSL